MKGAFACLIRAVEAHPIRTLALLAVLLLPLAAVASTAYAERWLQGFMERALVRADAELEDELREAAARVELEFDRLDRKAALLAQDPRIAELLRHPDGHLRQELQTYLHDYASGLGLHRAFVLDEGGMCVVSSDFNQTRSLEGQRFSDRAYFAEAMQGESGMQFVVGRVSSVPGIHMSRPVLGSDGRPLGVATVKMDLETVASHIHFSDGLVADTQGVVLLSEVPEHLLSTLPEAAANSLPVEELRLRYQTDTLRPLPMRPTRVAGREAVLLDDNPNPQLWAVKEVGGRGLSVYAFKEVAHLPAVEEQFRSHLVLALLLIYCSMLLGSAVGVWLLRDAAQRRRLMALNTELEHQARHDPLTGCFNRRHFDEVLEAELRRSNRGGRPLSLVLVDLDNFKNVNDTYGHHMGDRMLTHVADTLLAELRVTDLIARVGGEEFALLLPETSEDQAGIMLGRLLAVVEGRPLEMDGVILVQTFSSGVAMSRQGESADALLRRADLALYAAKRCGRNRMVRASSLRGVNAVEDVESRSCTEMGAD